MQIVPGAAQLLTSHILSTVLPCKYSCRRDGRAPTGTTYHIKNCGRVEICGLGRTGGHYPITRGTAARSLAATRRTHDHRGALTMTKTGPPRPAGAVVLNPATMVSARPLETGRVTVRIALH